MFVKSAPTVIRSLLAGGAMLFAASASHATTVLSFVDYIDNVVGEFGVQSNFSLGGLTVTAHGFNSTVGVGSFTSGPYAYFDRGNAGIGVCQVLNSGKQCAPSNDDNVTSGEILSLSFDKSMVISDLFFRDDGHIPNFPTGKNIDVAIGATAFESLDLESGATGLGAGLLNDDLANPIFQLAAGETINFKFTNQQFYLSGLAIDVVENDVVSTPATLPLFISALAGVAFFSRRRKQAA